MSVDIECWDIFLCFDCDCDRLVHDEIFCSFNSCLDLIISIHVDLYLIHHLEVSLLTELLDLGDDLSDVSLLDELRCKSCVENCEHVVVHAHYESLLGGDPDVNEILHKTVASLPEAQRTAILLRDYEGYSYQEIGDITGQTEAQVKTNIFRARTALRNVIKSMDNIIDIEP